MSRHTPRAVPDPVPLLVLLPPPPCTLGDVLGFDLKPEANWTLLAWQSDGLDLTAQCRKAKWDTIRREAHSTCRARYSKAHCWSEIPPVASDPWKVLPQVRGDLRAKAVLESRWKLIQYAA